MCCLFLLLLVVSLLLLVCGSLFVDWCPLRVACRVLFGVGCYFLVCGDVVVRC